MMIATHTGLRVAVLAAGALVLAGCGGSSGSGDATGQVSFSMTDAPVDDVYQVVIAMTEFELKPADGEAFRVAVIPDDGQAYRALDLLAFTNGESALLIDGEEVPAGEYEWLRIYFDEDSSYVVENEGGGQYPLFIPSGAQTGYKLVSGFTVPVNDSVAYVLDFDVRKSLRLPPGLGGPNGEERTYLLKPTVRIMNAEETGGVEGTVADELLALNNAETCAGGDVVYAFEGHDVDPLAAEAPLVTDVVELNIETGASEYHLAYLLPGDYTLAFSCSASLDDGETYPPAPPVDPADPAFGFSEQINVTVVSGEVKQCDIPQPLEATEPC